MIGFIGAPYEVNETDGFANVTVGVVSGQLMREVVVELSFSDGTAVGNFYCSHCTLIYLPNAQYFSSLILINCMPPGIVSPT